MPIESQNFRVSACTVATDSGAPILGEAVERAGWHTAMVIVKVAESAGDITAIQVQEDDTSGGTYSDIPGAAAPSASLPATGVAGGVYVFVIRLNPSRKAYIRAYAEEAGTDDVTLIHTTILQDGKQSPIVAAEYGADYIAVIG